MEKNDIVKNSLSHIGNTIIKIYFVTKKCYKSEIFSMIKQPLLKIDPTN